MGQAATRQEAFEADQQEWLARQFDELTVRMDVVLPSAWAEQKRYLPPSVSALPGPYSFEIAPFIREILDCLSDDSPVRELAIMKGVQICFTTGVLENSLGYYIEHVKTAPMMLITADSDLAQIRMGSYVVPMLQHSGLLDCIKSADETNARKKGKTDKKLEWAGGGFLLPIGARNPAKMRSTSVQVMLCDEVDGWPDTVGKDGDPVGLVRDRTAAYESARKLLFGSTPLVKGQSKIETLFKRGDQRRYFVRCLRCEHPQVLRWNRVDKETGVITGIVWELNDDGNLVPDSVRYLCESCGHPHSDADKPRLCHPDNAEWRPTAEPALPDVRSYHLSALYSPVGMQSWAACVQKWLEAWDVKRNQPKDIEKLQVFYNNVLGEPFEVRGDEIKFERASAHRRTVYSYGEVPNAFCEEFCGGPVLLVTCAVDVHKDSLKVANIGWTSYRRAVLLDYWTLEGTTEQLDDPATWGRLREILDELEYVADDGKRYRVELGVVDSGYLTDTVYQFCRDVGPIAMPIKGRGISEKSARVPEFAEFKQKSGLTVYGITVDLYKDRWGAALRRGWDGISLQPEGHFNAPLDITDKQLKELTAEVKRARIEKGTGKRLGFEWYRKSGAANELWDLLVYNNAALDLLAWNTCRQMQLDATHWPEFWRVCAEERPFFQDG